MTIHLMCITSSGGIPVFNRKKGEGEHLPFSALGALNGIHLFCKTYSYEIQNTKTEHGSVVWKEFHDSLVLIVISPSTSEDILQRFLTTVFSAMVLYVGLEQLIDIKSVERLKRDLRPCMFLVESLLENLESDLPYTECLLGPDTHTLASCLELYSEQIESPFSCLLINNRVSITTEAWWTLNFTERQLLSMVAVLDPTNENTVKELPLFLPYKSPNVAFRLIWAPVSSSSLLISLCGPSPNANEISNLIQVSWHKAYETLAAALLCVPRNFPLHIQVDSAILGVLLINLKMEKYFISRSPQLTGLKRSVSGAHRLDVLRAFYNQVMKTAKAAYRPKYSNNTTDELVKAGSSGEKPEDVMKNNNSDILWDGFESYWCSEYHRCHCLVDGFNMMCIMYGSIVPTCTMRIITQKTLKLFLSDKQIYW